MTRRNDSTGPMYTVKPNYPQGAETSLSSRNGMFAIIFAYCFFFLQFFFSIENMCNVVFFIMDKCIVNFSEAPGHQSSAVYTPVSQKKTR